MTRLGDEGAGQGMQGASHGPALRGEATVPHQPLVRRPWSVPGEERGQDHDTHQGAVPRNVSFLVRHPQRLLGGHRGQVGLR